MKSGNIALKVPVGIFPELVKIAPSFLLYGLVVIWTAAVIFWPEPSDVASLREESRQNTSGEDLYKASLTKAGFGLLGVRFYESSEGKKRWVINSRFAELHRKENYAFMQDVDALFFAAKTGNVVATKSNYGRSWTDKRLVELEGDVSVRSKRGYLFTMDRLNYNGDSHEFSSDDVVHMKGPVVDHPIMMLKGLGLLANIDEEHFLVRRNVVAQKKLKTSEWMKINSKSGEFFTDEQRAIFIGKVHSSLPQIAIDSDIFEMSLSQESESALARGNVVLNNRDRVGYAESASLELGGNRILLEGKARIDSKDNRIRGRRILLYTDDDRVEVEEAEGKVSK